MEYFKFIFDMMVFLKFTVDIMVLYLRFIVDVMVFFLKFIVAYTVDTTQRFAGRNLIASSG